MKLSELECSSEEEYLLKSESVYYALAFVILTVLIWLPDRNFVDHYDTGGTREKRLKKSKKGKKKRSKGITGGNKGDKEEKDYQ